MINKRNNKYSVSFTENELKDGTTGEKSIEFNFENHDNVFHIIDIIQDRKVFPTEDENTQFVIGLKLFGDVMMRNKNNPLFEELQPAFIQFMKKLKGK